MENNFNSYNDYGYVENAVFNAKTYDVSISENDKIISVTENGSLLGSVKLGVDNQTLSLIGKDGKEFSSVVLPSSSVVEDARYDDEKQALILTIKLSNNEVKEIEISFTDMLDDYAKKEDVEKNAEAITSLQAKDEEVDETLQSLQAKDEEVDEQLSRKVDITNLEVDGEFRKAIVLANNDTILGTTTTSNTVNISMVSKLDKIEIGSTQIEINLNGSGDRPTYNEVNSLALMSDIDNLATKSELTEAINGIGLEYITKDELEEKGFLTNIPDEYVTETEIDEMGFALKDEIKNGIYNLGEIDSFNNLSSLASAKGVCDNQDNVILTFKITTSTYGQESGFIINIINGKNISQALYWKQAVKPEMFRNLTISDEGEIDNPDFSPYNYPTPSNNLYVDKLSGYEIFTLTTEATSDEVKAALTDNTINQSVITATQLDECLATGKFLIDPTMSVPVFVGWNGQGYTLTSFGLPNPFGEAVLSTVTIRISGDTYSIVKNGSRSTILTQGNLENNLSKSSIVNNLSINDTVLASKLEMLEQKLEWLSKSNVEEQVLSIESAESYDDITKDYVVTGNETKNVTFNGKSVKFDNVAISNGAVTKINASDVELKGVTLSGDFPKTNSNAPIKLNEAEFVVIRDMVFDSSNVYNGIEIGLDSTKLPKSILFENCKFLGKFSNNVVSIFGTQDNAIINVNNCYFQEMSNPFRLSNKTNTKCTMNIVNCKFDKWETSAPYQGMIILQDYTSSSEEAVTNNLFGDGKITVNIINCTKPNGSKITKPSDISTVCGSGTDKQLVYVYYDNGGLIAYDANKYPILNIL